MSFDNSNFVSETHKDYLKAIDCIREIQNDVVQSSLKNCKSDEEEEMYKSIGDMMCALHKLQEEFTKMFERKIAEESHNYDSTNNENEIHTNTDNTPERCSSPEPGYNYSPQVFSENTRLKNIKKKNIKNLIKIIDIEPLNEVEFKLIPKYMIGRFSMDQINKFIETINTAINTKYTILSKTKAELKAKEYNQFLEYKKYETNDMKGKTFVLEQDIAEAQHRKNFDKASANMIVILRHMKRITETRNNGVLKIVIN